MIHAQCLRFSDESRATLGPMNSNWQSPIDPTVQQLLERERSLRMMASTALTIEESTALLALVEHYEALVAERQTHEMKQLC